MSQPLASFTCPRTPIDLSQVEVSEYSYSDPFDRQIRVEYSIRYKGILAGAAVTTVDGDFGWLFDMSDNPGDMRSGRCSDHESAINEVLLLSENYLSGLLTGDGASR